MFKRAIKSKAEQSDKEDYVPVTPKKQPMRRKQHEQLNGQVEISTGKQTNKLTNKRAPINLKIFRCFRNKGYLICD